MGRIIVLYIWILLLWFKNVTYVLSFISPLQVAQHVSGSCVVAAATAQHVTITLRSRQLLKMGTCLPETC